MAWHRMCGSSVRHGIILALILLNFAYQFYLVYSLHLWQPQNVRIKLFGLRHYFVLSVSQCLPHTEDLTGWSHFHFRSLWLYLGKMKIGKFSPFSLALVLTAHSKPGDEERGWKDWWLGRSNSSFILSADKFCLLLSNWPSGSPVGLAGWCSEISWLLSHEYTWHNFLFGCFILFKS